MQYDMRKLGQMTLEQLTEIAQNFDIKVGKNAVAQSVIYQILDAQADMAQKYKLALMPVKKNEKANGHAFKIHRKK